MIFFVVMEPISPEEVRAEVSRFWNVFSSKLKDKFEEMYFPSATVFSSTAQHTEPGRLMVARRLRQFFAPAISLRAEIGSIGVQLVGTNVAIATYIYRFRSTRVESDGTTIEVKRWVSPHVPGGQVRFESATTGKLTSSSTWELVEIKKP